jgi:hypothetical protein
LSVVGGILCVQPNSLTTYSLHRVRRRIISPFPEAMASGRPCAQRDREGQGQTSVRLPKRFPVCPIKSSWLFDVEIVRGEVGRRAGAGGREKIYVDVLPVGGGHVREEEKATGNATALEAPKGVAP